MVPIQIGAWDRDIAIVALGYDDDDFADGPFSIQADGKEVASLSAAQRAVVLRNRGSRDPVTLVVSKAAVARQSSLKSQLKVRSFNKNDWTVPDSGSMGRAHTLDVQKYLNYISLFLELANK